MGSDYDRFVSELAKSVPKSEIDGAYMVRFLSWALSMGDISPKVFKKVHVAHRRYMVTLEDEE